MTKAAAGTLAALACSTLVAGCAGDPPQVPRWDGLQPVSGRNAAAAYTRPGVEFAGYRKVMIDGPVEVAFGVTGMARRPDPEDLQQMRADLGEMLRSGLSRELSNNGYSVVSVPAVDTLRVTVSVADLAISVPDASARERDRSYTTSADSMTLVLEAHDSTSGELLARAVDARADAKGSIVWTNAAANQADAERAVGTWARRLRDGLDRLTGRSR